MGFLKITLLSIKDLRDFAGDHLLYSPVRDFPPPFFKNVDIREALWAKLRAGFALFWRHVWLTDQLSCCFAASVRRSFSQIIKTLIYTNFCFTALFFFRTHWIFEWKHAEQSPQSKDLSEVSKGFVKLMWSLKGKAWEIKNTVFAWKELWMTLVQRDSWRSVWIQWSFWNSLSKDLCKIKLSHTCVIL